MDLPDLLAGASIKADIGFGVGDLEQILRDVLAAQADADRAAAKDVLYLDQLTAEGTTSATGTLTIIPNWQAPQGSRINIHRLTIDYAGSNPAAPQTTTGIKIYRQAIAQAPGNIHTIGSSLPAVFEYSNERVALVIRSNDSPAIVLTGAPDSTLITVSADVSVTRETL